MSWSGCQLLDDYRFGLGQIFIKQQHKHMYDDSELYDSTKILLCFLLVTDSNICKNLHTGTATLFHILALIKLFFWFFSVFFY